MSNITNSIPPVTRNLIIINCAVLLLQEVLARTTGIDLVSIFGLHFMLASDFHIYQTVTYMFLHGGLTHLFFNMFALWMFGGIIEQTLGRKRFIAYYFLCGIGAALCQELWQLTQFFYQGLAQYQAVNLGSQIIPMTAFLNEAWTTVGASGACYGVLLAFGVLYPEQRIMLLIPPIPMKAKYFVFAYAVIELFSAYASNDNIAHFAHLGGMLFGWLVLRHWRKCGGTGLPFLEKVWDKVRGLFRRKNGATQFRPAGGSGMHGRESDYEYNIRKKREQERVDEILEKISRSGYDALTPEEKRDLFKFSDK